MSIVFGHVNIIAADWEKLSRFYQDVFDCVPVPPRRDLSGPALAAGAGLENPHLVGEHLRLPGLGENGPTLEIYSYDTMLEKYPPAANRKGFGHCAFQVDDVRVHVEKVLACGGSLVGSVVDVPVPGKGIVTFVYVADPEGNILELQSWKK